jgi:hypothetical protein
MIDCDYYFLNYSVGAKRPKLESRLFFLYKHDNFTHNCKNLFIKYYGIQKDGKLFLRVLTLRHTQIINQIHNLVMLEKTCTTTSRVVKVI